MDNFYTYGKFNSDYHPVVAKFDPVKYSGLWYEIARYDTLPFEKGCSSVTAFYEWNPNNKTMRITNNCPNLGKSDQGTAWIPNPKYPGKLSVAFDRFPQFASSYWVHYTDYVNFAIVGGSGNEFLWILSRRPVINRRDVKFLLSWVSALGYDNLKLIHDPKDISDNAQPITVATPEPLFVSASFSGKNIKY